MTMASAMVSSATATRMNGRFTDMVPVTPGSLTRRREATRETASSAMNSLGFRGPLLTRARANAPMPQATTRAMKAFEIGERFFMVSVLADSALQFWSESPDSENVTLLSVQTMESPHTML